ncbi:MAG: hypothetical protein INR70_37315 [Parafilimonas terrae]|nr:hypothetical protein [Parafilimonas terrae]
MPLTGETLKRTIEIEIRRATAGDGMLRRGLRGEPFDLGNPTVNAVVERTARRFAAIPDAIIPRMQEVRSRTGFETILNEMILDAFAEIDVLFGVRTADEIAAAK